MGCIHMTIQTGVLIETLIELGASVRWSSCNIFSTQDHAAAAIAARASPYLRGKAKPTKNTSGAWSRPSSRSEALGRQHDPGRRRRPDCHAPRKVPGNAGQLHGVTEETTTGVHRLQEMLRDGVLKVPAINVNDAVTKSKNDNKYGCRHSLNDAIKRGTDHLMAGKKALVIGYGDVGKGSAPSLRQEGMIVQVTEVDPICAMQACMDGYEVVLPS